MSKGVSDNIARVRRYEIYAMYEKRAALVVAPLLLLAVMIWRAVVMNDAPWYWAAVAGAMVVAVLYCVWYYKKFYAANMHAIKRGLEELKEL
jgi:O-antigen/teichoic acid export membrane protein